VRDISGNDTVLIPDDGKIFGWPRWSPQGDKIVFMESNLGISDGQQSAWIISKDGSNPQKLSSITWNYPPAWSPDGTKIAFANGSNVWEYDVSQKSLNKLTDFNSGSSQHPAYSADGSTIVFSSNNSGTKQVWSVHGGKATQLSSGSGDKDYPVVP
jgi:TolB protein